MKRPVVGIVTTWFERGAAYVSRAYREALSECCDVQIYARGGEQFAQGDPRWDGLGVWWTQPAPDTAIGRADFERWIQKHRVQLVLFNEQHWWPPVFWARGLGARTVAYVDYYTPETAPWFQVYDALWCNTRRHFSVFDWHPRARYIPWGTDLELFRPQERIRCDEIVFFHSAGMGGVNLRKGTDLLVAAFRQVQGPARLIIHSQVPAAAFGATGTLLRRDPRIELVERTVPAPGLYHLGDVYVYPTRLEGIGLTVAEALACGLPVIATDAAPCNEFVVPRVNGWLAPIARTRRREDGYYWPETECDIQGLARIMQACVDRKHERPDWRRRARDYAEAHLDWRKNSQGLTTAVDELLASPPCPIPKRVEGEIILKSNMWRLRQRVNRRSGELRAYLKAKWLRNQL